jgi:hypothetical protein
MRDGITNGELRLGGIPEELRRLVNVYAMIEGHTTREIVIDALESYFEKRSAEITAKLKPVKKANNARS